MLGSRLSFLVYIVALNLFTSLMNKDVSITVLPD